MKENNVVNNSISETIKQKLLNNDDVMVRNLNVLNHIITIIYLKSMCDKTLLSHTIIEPILHIKNENDLNLESIQQKYISANTVKQVETIENCVEEILKNQLILFIDNKPQFLAIDIEFFPTRAIMEPPTSAVLQGPREGFVEDIKTNISLVRRRFPSPHLKLINLEVGRLTKTKVCVCFLNNVADKKIVKEIVKKIESIGIDGIVDAFYIAEFLEDRPSSIFKQVGICEKPDILSGKMLEGRIGILVDNSPTVLTLPFVYLEDMQSSNDYYSKPIYASFVRMIRLLGVLMSVLTPALYLTLRLYHYKILPLKFLITISNSTQNIPFPPFIEILFILILFEILYEVSLRLPRYLGLATSIVGALILGDTGVKAGLISPPGVMIVALSLIAIYTVPDQIYQITILRFIFLLLGGTVGIFGIIGGIIFFINHLSSFNSYGAPYLAPFAPYIKNDKKDAIFKVPIDEMRTRPKSIKNTNPIKLKIKGGKNARKSIN